VFKNGGQNGRFRVERGESPAIEEHGRAARVPQSVPQSHLTLSQAVARGLLPTVQECSSIGVPQSVFLNRCSLFGTGARGGKFDILCARAGGFWGRFQDFGLAVSGERREDRTTKHTKCMKKGRAYVAEAGDEPLHQPPEVGTLGRKERITEGTGHTDRIEDGFRAPAARAIGVRHDGGGDPGDHLPDTRKMVIGVRHDGGGDPWMPGASRTGGQARNDK